MSIVDSITKHLKKAGPAGLVVGFIALLACELPIVLALVGLGSLGTITSFLRPPFGAKTALFMVIVLGSVVLTAVLFRRLWSRNRPDVE